MSCIFY